MSPFSPFRPGRKLPLGTIGPGGLRIDLSIAAALSRWRRQRHLRQERIGGRSRPGGGGFASSSLVAVPGIFITFDSKSNTSMSKFKSHPPRLQPTPLQALSPGSIAAITVSVSVSALAALTLTAVLLRIRSTRAAQRKHSALEEAVSKGPSVDIPTSSSSDGEAGGGGGAASDAGTGSSNAQYYCAPASSAAALAGEILGGSSSNNSLYSLPPLLLRSRPVSEPLLSVLIHPERMAESAAGAERRGGGGGGGGGELIYRSAGDGGGELYPSSSEGEVYPGSGGFAASLHHLALHHDSGVYGGLHTGGLVLTGGGLQQQQQGHGPESPSWASQAPELGFGDQAGGVSPWGGPFIAPDSPSGVVRRRSASILGRRAGQELGAEAAQHHPWVMPPFTTAASGPPSSVLAPALASPTLAATFNQYQGPSFYPMPAAAAADGGTASSSLAGGRHHPLPPPASSGRLMDGMAAGRARLFAIGEVSNEQSASSGGGGGGGIPGAAEAEGFAGNAATAGEGGNEGRLAGGLEGGGGNKGVAGGEIGVGTFFHTHLAQQQRLLLPPPQQAAHGHLQQPQQQPQQHPQAVLSPGQELEQLVQTHLSQQQQQEAVGGGGGGGGGGEEPEGSSSSGGGLMQQVQLDRIIGQGSFGVVYKGVGKYEGLGKPRIDAFGDLLGSSRGARVDCRGQGAAFTPNIPIKLYPEPWRRRQMAIHDGRGQGAAVPRRLGDAAGAATGANRGRRQPGLCGKVWGAWSQGAHDTSATMQARQQALTEAAVSQVCVGKYGKVWEAWLQGLFAGLWLRLGSGQPGVWKVVGFGVADGGPLLPVCCGEALHPSSR